MKRYCLRATQSSFTRAYSNTDFVLCRRLKHSRCGGNGIIPSVDIISLIKNGHSSVGLKTGLWPFSLLKKHRERRRIEPGKALDLILIILRNGLPASSLPKVRKVLTENAFSRAMRRMMHAKQNPVLEGDCR